jgi:hypothetical protein
MQSIPSDDIKMAMRAAIQEIMDFVSTAPFSLVLDELYALPKDQRPKFVEQVLLNSQELQERGILPPADLVIQRSAFGDGRPTLFCVSKPVPEGHAWKKVTVTFDEQQRPA